MWWCCCGDDVLRECLDYLRPEEALRLAACDRAWLRVVSPHMPRLWETNDSKLYPGTTIWIERERWRPTPRRIAVVSEDGEHAVFQAGAVNVRVRLWNYPRPRRVRTLPVHFFVCS